MAPLVKLASCNLNQWAMDFKGNLARIEESVRVAKAAGCTFRTGPELAKATTTATKDAP